jgi:hypothetical protein
MFEAMTLEGRLSVIQKKRLCQFCLWHPDTQPCPSHSLPACPIRGCMQMHHKMLHRALLREEARPVVLGMAQGAGGHILEGNLLTSDSEDSALVTSDEEEGGELEKSRLCMQMVPVEANNIIQGLHARATAAARTRRPDPEAGPHDGHNGTGDATGVQLQHRHWMRGTAGHGYSRAKDLPAGWIRRRDWNLSDEGRVGHEAVEETTCDSLHGNAVISILHVRIGRPGEESQVWEVPATLWSAISSVLRGPEERQAEDWRDGIPHDDEPDQKSHGRRGRVLRKLQTAGQSPGKKNSLGTHGSPGGGRLDLVERREEPSGHQVREGDHRAQRWRSHPRGWAVGVGARG